MTGVVVDDDETGCCGVLLGGKLRCEANVSSPASCCDGGRGGGGGRATAFDVDAGGGGGGGGGGGVLLDLVILK